MKRKIAILLTATMALSAVPTFAVKTEAPKAVNTTTVASGQVIFEQDENYKELAPNILNYPITSGNSKKENTTAYKSYLANRDGLLNIELNSGNEFDGNIKKGDKFEIKLEGGKFTVTGKDNPAVAYRNTAILVDNTTAAKDVLVKYYVKEDNTGVTKVHAKYVESSSETEKMLSETTLSGFISKELDPTSTKNIDDSKTGADKIKEAQVAKALAPLPTIPYSIEIKDETTATVEFLHNISYEDIKDSKISVPEGYAVKTDNGTKKVDRVRAKQVYLSIPLGAVVESTGEEEVKVHVDGYGSKMITDGTVTLAKSMGSGSTAIETRYVDKKVFESDFQPSDIIVRENIRGTFNEDQITVRLNSGFEFMGTATDVKVVKASGNVDVLKPDTAKISEDKNKITFTLNKAALKSSDKEAIKIQLPKIQPVDESKNYGEVSINIYGGGISDQTITVGERQQLGFKLETKGDIPTIVKGRYAALNGALKQNSNNTAEFEFSEMVPESLLTARSLDFNVPEGVKIVDVESINMTGLGYANDMNKAVTIKNDGKTLRFERNQLKDTNAKSTAKIKLKLKLSIDAAFEGEEVKIAVTGGGSNETYETVIAKVASPFKVETKTKDINIGYQDYAVNDIMIEETEAGMFMEGGVIDLKIAAPYGTSEMGFTKAKVMVSEGDVEIEPIKGKDDNGYGYLMNGGRNEDSSIKIKVKTKSSKTPAKITISDVKIGTTRSVPFGAYNLEISGNALINNDVVDAKKAYVNGYTENDFTNINFKLNSAAKEADKAERIDAKTSNFTVPGYVNVVTANSTIDKEVKVAIGSTNAMVNGKEVVMDVAPYIQGTGNTMVPLRFVAVALAGGDASSVEAAQNSDRISWDQASKTVTIFYGAGINQKIIQFKIGSTNMIVDGNVIPMGNGAKAEIKDGRTFVPFRALGQALGVSVDWDQETKTAIYNKQ